MASLDDLPISGFFEFFTEKDDFTNLAISDPVFGFDESNLAIKLNWGFFDLLAEKIFLELLKPLLVVLLIHAGIYTFLRNVDQFSIDCVEEVRFATANIANDADKFSFSDVEIEVLKVQEFTETILLIFLGLVAVLEAPAEVASDLESQLRVVNLLFDTLLQFSHIEEVLNLGEVGFRLVEALVSVRANPQNPVKFAEEFSANDDSGKVDAFAHQDVERVNNSGSDEPAALSKPHLVDSLFILVFLMLLGLISSFSDSIGKDFLPAEEFDHLHRIEHFTHKIVLSVFNLFNEFPVFNFASNKLDAEGGAH